MNISKSALENQKLLSFNTETHNNNGNIYKVSDEVIYKIFKYFYAFQDEVYRNVEFQINNPIPNTAQILEPIYLEGKFSGYSMIFIPNAVTFREAIVQNMEVENKIKAIKDVYEALRFLHQHNIFLGDIHSDNFLIDPDGHGYLIDLDFMRFLGDEYKFQQCYVIKPNNNAYKINVASVYTDNAKVMLSSLSLLLNLDLENFISKSEHAINLEEIYQKVILPLNISWLNDYFCHLINVEDVPYFDTLLSSSFLLHKKN